VAGNDRKRVIIAKRKKTQGIKRRLEFGLSGWIGAAFLSGMGEIEVIIGVSLTQDFP